MDITVLASSSKGNCYKINNAGTTLLIECGISIKEIQKKLNYTLSNIDACLVTHSHKDHAKAVKDLARLGIDCYLSSGTAEELEIKGHRIKTLEKQEEQYKVVKIGGFAILPFTTIHDTKEPVGFFIQDINTSETLVFITDTAYIPVKFKSINYLMIECNYVTSVLDSNNINTTLRNRIVKNHMSLETVLEFLKENDLSRLQKIYVMHLSDNNSDENIIKEEIQKATGKQVIIC